MLPQLQAAGAELHAIATANGISARETGAKYGFSYCTSQTDEVINDPSVNLVVIATRHDTHAPERPNVMQASVRRPGKRAGARDVSARR